MVRKFVVWILVYALVFMLGLLTVNLGTVAWIDGVGSSLVAAGMAGWITLAWVVFNEKRQRQLEVAAEFGIVNAFPFRSVQIRTEYESRLEKVGDRIDIMGFGLRHLLEDMGDQFERWTHSAQVRVLLINPDTPTAASAYADQRDAEEGSRPGAIRQDVRNFLERTAELRKKPDFQVRLYKCLPSVNIFRIDDEMFFGPYLLGGVSRNLPTLIVRQGGVLFDRLDRHFNEVWNDHADPV